jgi:hypothetical protein
LKCFINFFNFKVDDLQKRMLAMAGQDVDAYLKEMEEVHRQTQAEKAAQLQSRMDAMSQQQQQQPEVQPRRFGAVPPGPPPGLPPSFAVNIFCHPNCILK